MATLDDNQVISIIKTNPNGKFIKFLQGEYTIMRSHVTGIGADKLIKQIEGFERKNIVTARKRMMLSNKDLLKRVMKPRNKIYTAKGGIESYNLSTSELIQEYKIFLSTCAGKRTSLKQFIQETIQTAYDIDPMGLKWVGINSDGEVYPDYKCIMGIYDYEIKDGSPEYVVFKCSDKDIQQYRQAGIVKGTGNPQVFRAVCDSWDRIVVWENEDPKIEAQISNVFGFVPGEVVSDIVCEDEAGNKYYQSCIYAESELLNQAVFARSIYNIAYSQTAYPLMWMQKQTCPTCGGKKKVGQSALNGGAPSNGDMECPECKGTGVYPHFQNSDTFIWEFSKDMDGKVPVPPLGIIETAIENLQYMKEEKADIETLITESIWGVARVAPNARPVGEQTREGSGNTSETAFEAALNDEPKKDVQKRFSRWGGNTYKWFADTMGKVKYETGYISSAILWGDRYAAESPDEILTRITKAKAAGAAQAILQSLHIEYLETVYENNPLELREQMIYYIGEPYFFFSVADVLTWPQIPQIQLIEKQMWGEFICTLTKQDIAAIPDEDIPGTVAKIYRDWVIKKYTADKQMDALLFANDGSQLVIGDNARVKVNLAKDPKDLGKTFKVDNIVTGKNGNTVQMSCDGVQCEYMSNELERVF